LARFARVSKLLNLGYVRAFWYSADNPMSRAQRRLTLMTFVAVVTLLGPGVCPALAQFTPYRSGSGNILEGSWQSCREADGRFSERVYDHVVNGVGLFEVHLGPGREFAIFPGVQEGHRRHDSPGNLLKAHVVPMRSNRAKQRWEVPSLSLAFTVTMGGGSRTDCENWYILLEPLQKKS
jgi:hypothetical protein